MLKIILTDANGTQVGEFEVLRQKRVITKGQANYVDQLICQLRQSFEQVAQCIPIARGAQIYADDVALLETSMSTEKGVGVSEDITTQGTVTLDIVMDVIS